MKCVALSCSWTSHRSHVLIGCLSLKRLQQLVIPGDVPDVSCAHFDLSALAACLVDHLPRIFYCVKQLAVN